MAENKWDFPGVLSTSLLLGSYTPQLKLVFGPTLQSSLGFSIIFWYKVGRDPTRYNWGEITPITRVKEPQLPNYKAIYRGPITPFMTGFLGPPCMVFYHFLVAVQPPSVPSGSLFLGPSSSLWSYSRYIVGLKRFRGIGGSLGWTFFGGSKARKSQEKLHGHFFGVVYGRYNDIK